MIAAIKTKRLPLSFTRWGFLWTQFAREDDVAAYTQDSVSKGELGSRHYVVLKITTSPPDPRYDKGEYAAVEHFPSPQEAGRLMWTYTNPENAQMKFKEMKT